MKTLLVVRHAKSSWADPGLGDRDRPLNRRGLADAPQMGERLRRRGDIPQAIVASVALRAAATARALAAALGFAPDAIRYDESLYTFDSAQLLGCVQSFDDTWTRCLLVGHNPAVTELVNDLGYCDIDNVPTCGMVKLTLPVTRWSDLAPGRGSMDYFDYPKNDCLKNNPQY
ncbi:SixA phosphatase family protein [Exilibacterium tricleocarpae]|uniref:SixA phosphatase family protein n=1 Tax=Exilibacterium tricleocarpae TaxID=2591008 RepID=UPI001C55271B|nr:histidine phosphatase family protein [Exilibacterium tricleocarpae]